MTHHPSEPNPNDPDPNRTLPPQPPPPPQHDDVFDEIEIVPEEASASPPLTPDEAVEVFGEEVIDVTEADVVPESSKFKRPVPASDYVVDEIEVVEEPASALEVVEEAPPVKPPQVRSPIPTMIADPDEFEALGMPPDMPNLELESRKYARLADEDSGIVDVVEAVEEEVFDAAPASAPHLGTLPPPAPAKADVSEEVMAGDDVLDVTEEASARAPKPKAESGTDLDAVDEILVEGGSEVVLDKREADHGMPSGVDLIAEALESGVDLAGDGTKTTGTSRRRPKSDEAIDMEQPREGGESSAVDLGSTGRPRRLAKGDASAEVISTTGPVSEIEAVEDAIDEEQLSKPGLKPKRILAPVAVVSDARGKQKPPRARGGAGKVLVGMALGILLAVGGAAAFWFLAPPETLQSLVGAPKGPSGIQPNPFPGAARPTPAGEARALIGKGDFDQALAKLKDAEDADELAARGEARWQKYLKEQRDKQAALDPSHEGVKIALEDFKKANNDFYPAEIDKAVKADKAVRDKLASLETSDQAIREALLKADRLPKDNADLAKAVAAALAGGQDAGLTAVMRQALIEAKLLDDKAKVTPESFRALALDLAEARNAAEEVRKYLSIKFSDIPKMVKELNEEREALAVKQVKVNESLKSAGVKGLDAAGVQELAEAREALAKQRDALDGAIAAALKELNAGNPPPGGDAAKQLVEGVKAARQKAESPLGASLNQMFSAMSGLGSGLSKALQSGVASADRSAELAAARAKAALSETPEQRLDTMIALNRSRDHKDPQDVVRATRFLEWANAKDSKAPAELKSKAQWALGLAQRNQGQVTDAVQTLKVATAAAAELKTGAAWAKDLQLSLRELTDPTAYYLPRTRQLVAGGNPEAALAELTEGLKVMPGDPQLTAVRGLVRVEAPALDPAAEASLRDDAAMLQKNPPSAAVGYYVQGRLEERLGNLKKAEDNYRNALKAHQGSEQEARMYSSALVRLLLRERLADDPPSKDKGGTTGGDDESDPDAAALLVLTMTALQLPGEGDDAATVRLKEALKLAEELTASSDPQTKGHGLMLLGQILTKQGKKSDGMLKFVEGMKLIYGGKDIAELEAMMKEHPAFQLPDAPGQYSPLMADRHYGKGLEHYWAGRYQDAEAEFARAIGYYDQDARYFYFLGLARHQQPGAKKRESAVLAFSQGAALESASRPQSAQVNASLERIQGETRRLINGFRRPTGGGS